MQLTARLALLAVVATAALAGVVAPSSAAEEAEPTASTSTDVQVVESDAEPVQPLLRPVAGRATGNTCTSQFSQRVTRSGKTAHDLLYNACVQTFGSKVQIRGSIQRYWANNKHLNPNAPTFEWFHTNIRLEASNGRTWNATCKTKPRPSQFVYQGHDSSGSVQGYHRHYPKVCYFEVPQQAGVFYRASVQHRYEVDGDGKPSIYSSRATTNYLRG